MHVPSDCTDKGECPFDHIACGANFTLQAAQYPRTNTRTTSADCQCTLSIAKINDLLSFLTT